MRTSPRWVKTTSAHGTRRSRASSPSGRRPGSAPSRPRSRRAGSRALDPPLQRRMGIEDDLLQTIGTAFGQVQQRQSLHGADERRGVTSRGQREVVGLALDPPREPVSQRELDQPERQQYQRQPRKAGGIGGARRARRAPPPPPPPP